MVAEARARSRRRAPRAAVAGPEAAAERCRGAPPDEDAKPLEDRYVDDGSVTVDDRKKFSLRRGGTATALPTVGGAVPGERMSDAEMMGEIGGGKKRIVIIGIAVAVVAIVARRRRSMEVARRQGRRRRAPRR